MGLLKRFVHSEQAFYQEHSVLSDSSVGAPDVTFFKVISSIYRSNVRLLGTLGVRPDASNPTVIAHSEAVNENVHTKADGGVSSSGRHAWFGLASSIVVDRTSMLRGRS